MERKLIVSRIQTPDGTILQSNFVHDFQSHKDQVTGEVYILDGGRDYQRISVNSVPAKDLSIYSDAPFEEIRENLTRGTFDVEGNRIWKPICECTDTHLKNILIYNNERGLGDSMFSHYIKMEQEYRKEHNISIPDSNYFF